MLLMKSVMKMFYASIRFFLISLPCWMLAPAVFIVLVSLFFELEFPSGSRSKTTFDTSSPEGLQNTLPVFFLGENQNCISKVSSRTCEVWGGCTWLSCQRPKFEMDFRF